TEPYPPATDDYPIQEYSGAAQPLDHLLLTRLFDPSRAPSWCPACLVDGRPRPGLEGLPRHLALLAGIYRDPAFVHYAAPSSQATRVFRVALDHALAAELLERRLERAPADTVGPEELAAVVHHRRLVGSEGRKLLAVAQGVDELASHSGFARGGRMRVPDVLAIQLSRGHQHGELLDLLGQRGFFAQVVVQQGGPLVRLR